MRPLDLSQRQVRAICEGARKAGYVPEFVIGKTVVRLIPDTLANRPQEDAKVDDGGDIRL